jgi:hypothetical protein
MILVKRDLYPIVTFNSYIQFSKLFQKRKRGFNQIHPPNYYKKEKEVSIKYPIVNCFIWKPLNNVQMKKEKLNSQIPISYSFPDSRYVDRLYAQRIMGGA